LHPGSILNIGDSWNRYKKYARITLQKHISGESWFKAANISGDETGLTCWIKDEGYANITIELKENDKGEKEKIFSKDGKKILVSYKHRLPAYVSDTGIIQVDFEKKYRYVDPQYIRGGKFPCKRHEWEKGEHMIQDGLTHRGKKTLKLAANCMGTLTSAKEEKTNFITLTYGKDVPTDPEAKKHLKQFFQRLQRQFGCKFHYIWAAEMQKGTEGSYRDINGAAIHFHILIDRKIKITTKQREQYKNTWIAPDLILNRCTGNRDYQDRLDMLKWVNYHWNDIVNKWQSRNNLPIQTITRTDCELVNDASSYISKYLSKESANIIGRMWGIADITRDLIKPTEIVTYDLPIKYAEKIMQEAIATFFDQYMCQYEQDEKGNYVEVKSKNYMTVTDKTSVFFNKDYIPKDYDSLNAPLVTDYESYKKDLQYRHEHQEKERGKELYQFQPDYPIAWTNNAEALQDIIEDLIEYYDNYIPERKKIKSLVYMYD